MSSPPPLDARNGGRRRRVLPLCGAFLSVLLHVAALGGLLLVGRVPGDGHPVAEPEPLGFVAVSGTPSRATPEPDPPPAARAVAELMRRSAATPPAQARSSGRERSPVALPRSAPAAEPPPPRDVQKGHMAGSQNSGASISVSMPASVSMSTPSAVLVPAPAGSAAQASPAPVVATAPAGGDVAGPASRAPAAGSAGSPSSPLPASVGARMLLEHPDPDCLDDVEGMAGRRELQARICVAASGRVTDVTVIRSPGDDVSRCVSRHIRATWRYRPLTVDGSAVPFCYVAAFVFE